MNLSDDVRQRIEATIRGSRVVLFMKGTPQQPMCGFSARTVAALGSVTSDYAAVNVLEDEAIREGIKVFGNWPTIPQLYIDGELVGGCDIVLSMLNSGELHRQLGLAPPDRRPPEITITDAAADMIREALRGHEGLGLHYQVDAGWESQFSLAPIQGSEIVAESNGIRVAMDLATAQRAAGAVIDWVSNVNGEGLSVVLPAAPPPVHQISVRELADRLAANDIRLIDVRSNEDRAKAKIAAAVALDQAVMEELSALPKDTALAFICHHGNSSQGAAEYFRKQGFTAVCNVAGGIDAWSVEIDPTVPRY